MALIETIHRATIFYKGDADIVDAIEAKAFGWAGALVVETMSGNAACSPYMTADGSDADEVTIWAAKVERYIQGRKGARLDS